MVSNIVLALFLTLNICIVLSDETNRIPLYVGGLLQSEAHSIPAIQTCLRHANELSGILDGYELILRWNITQRHIPACGMMKYLYEYVYVPPTVLAIIGPMYSDLSLEMNGEAGAYGLNQVTEAVSPTLKDRTLYPLTIQTYQDNSQLTSAKAAYVKQMGWKQVAMVNENMEAFLQTSSDLELLLSRERIKVVFNDVIIDDVHIVDIIKRIMRRDVKIIFTEMYVPTRAKFMCQAYKRGLRGRDYVWFIPGYTQSDWWVAEIDNIPCSMEEMEALTSTSRFIGFEADIRMNSDFSTIDLNGVKLNEDHISEMTETVSSLYSALSYDSCMTLVLGINGSIADLASLDPSKRLEEFKYSDFEIANAINDNLLNVDFIGATGRLRINQDGVRVNDIAIKELRDSEWTVIGKYDTSSGNIMLL